jgi:hypothetical protein
LAAESEIAMQSKESTIEIKFHSGAAERYQQLADSLLATVQTYGRIEEPSISKAKIYPVMHLSEKDIIGPIKMQEHAVNGMGHEAGRFWNSGGHRVGWEGEKFEAIKQFVSKLASSNELKGKASERFLVDEVFKWLRETLEKLRSDGIADYIAQRCSEVIRDREIWIPIYRTYSSHEFPMGDVEFRILSEVMMEKWFSNVSDLDPKSAAAFALNRDRSYLQGTLAARVRVVAEPQKAREIAHTAADEAIAMVRFLSPANWTCQMVSYCAPIGRENIRSAWDLVIEEDEIKGSGQSVFENGPPAWDLDEARNTPFGFNLLERLHEVAMERHKNKLCADLYRILQLHAQNSLTASVSQKIVFVVAAAESLLLRNGSEPIQKNLGERLAFLTEQTVEGRRKVVRNVDEFYRLRSSVVHHGHEVQESEKPIVDLFFFNIWLCLVQMLANVGQFKTREEIFEMIEIKKFT